MTAGNLGKPVSIGELSRRTGCNVETVWYYERVGVIPKPPRTEGGHRCYPVEQVKRLVFVRRGRELGFTLDQIRGLLKFVDTGQLRLLRRKGVDGRAPGGASQENCGLAAYGTSAEGYGGPVRRWTGARVPHPRCAVDCGVGRHVNPRSAPLPGLV